MRITVFGTGYVGLVQGAVLAEVGHDGFDPRPRTEGDGQILSACSESQNQTASADLQACRGGGGDAVVVAGAIPAISRSWMGREPAGVFRHASGSRKDQTISGPPRSAAGLAPTCSTRRVQFAPR